MNEVESLEKAFSELREDGQEYIEVGNPVDTFVLRWDDPAAPMALYTYALHARRNGMSEESYTHLISMVDDWEKRQYNGE